MLTIIALILLILKHDQVYKFLVLFSKVRHREMGNRNGDIDFPNSNLHSKVWDFACV